MYVIAKADFEWSYVEQTINSEYISLEVAYVCEALKDGVICEYETSATIDQIKNFYQDMDMAINIIEIKPE